MKLFMVVLAVAVLAAGCGCETIEPGNVGVEVNMGTVRSPILKEGFHWVGVMSDVHEMTTQTQTYTMAGAGTPGQGDGSVNVLARDQLPVQMEVSVMFHLNQEHAIKVFRIFGVDYANSIIHPLVRTAVRDAASEYRAVELVDDRAGVQARMEKLVEESLRGTLRSRRIAPGAIVVDNILVRNIDLPQSLEESIANVQRQAQQTAQRQQALLTARAESERAKTEMEGNAQAQLIRARGDAEAQLVRARAQSEANKIVAASLTGEVLRLRQIEAQQALLSNTSTRLVVVPAGTNTTLMMPGAAP